MFLCCGTISAIIETMIHIQASDAEKPTSCTVLMKLCSSPALVTDMAATIPDEAFKIANDRKWFLTDIARLRYGERRGPCPRSVTPALPRVSLNTFHQNEPAFAGLLPGMPFRVMEIPGMNRARARFLVLTAQLP
jgi:hypothetical protein